MYINFLALLELSVSILLRRNLHHICFMSQIKVTCYIKHIYQHKFISNSLMFNSIAFNFDQCFL